ncbi:S41 family peptidase [Undibacterium fentianense]|uniref:S41 family peptidase n=1 Tax=Undibacterium fentianense TaxID=2828728 RepID=A0A941E138_9BURK|nr:S41 family peptidase [Undibacterium fentianense]MBR7800435.1 S41 family peptidase [Undibacterium fentianense]
MGSKLKSLGLVCFGVVAGIAVSIQYSALAQKVNMIGLPLEKISEFSEVFGMIKSDYVEPVDDEKLLSEAINGMVSSLDPHSAYLDKKAFKELREGTEGKFVGLGIEVGMEDGYVKVISPIEDSPASRAGIQPSDLITRIDGVPVKGLGIDEAVKKMRGEPNTKITLTILRKTEDKPVVITLTRELIKQYSVKAKLVEPGYAWLRISQFQEPTVDDMVKKVVALYAQDPHLKGLVLDLRNDPGGVLPGAIGVSAAFLPKDVAVVSTNGQVEDSKRTYFAKKEFYASRGGADPLAKLPAAIKQIPMVVLINTGSASASEIVAGALQDYRRATIMGTQSYGKGSVQTVHQISEETAIKLTTARYYTPMGRAIQAKGIQPDLRVEETANGDGYNALRSREADLQKHLRNDRESEAEASTVDELEEEKRLVELAKNSPPLEFGSKDDFQLQQALNHLKGLPVKVVAAKDATMLPASESSQSKVNSPSSKPNNLKHSQNGKKQ